MTKIIYRTKKVREYWEGDYMRGPQDDGVRSGVFERTFVSPDNAGVYQSALTYLQCQERVTGIDRGTYFCQVLEACEEECEPAIDLDDKVTQECRRCFERMEVEKEIDEPSEDWIQLDLREKKYIKIAEPNPQIKEEIGSCIGERK